MQKAQLVPIAIYLRALVSVNAKQPKPQNVFFLQPVFPLNAYQMQEFQGCSSTSHYHLNADMLYSNFLLLFHLPALLVTVTDKVGPEALHVS